MVAERLPIRNYEFVRLSIGQLIPYAKNSRKHSDIQIKQVVNSITEFGFTNPILIDEEFNIIAGHCRVMAAQKLNMHMIPCVILAGLTESQKRAYVIADNKLALNAEWDIDILLSEVNQLQDDGFDVEMTGFSLDEIADLTPDVMSVGLCDDDAVPETPDEPITKLGDIYTLGNHRLMCGDSTMIDSVDKMMNGEKADIGFTSPPYNANKNSGGLIEKKYKNDEDAKDDSDYLQFLIDFTNNSIIHCEYSFINIQMLSHNKIPLFDWQNHFKDKIKDIIIWVKKICPPQINKGTFNSKWEYLFCFSDQSKSRAFPCKWQGQYPNVIETMNASQNEFADIHKATFPVEFPEWIIERMDFCKSVLDLFGGSGSTLIACEKTNRQCYMMELSPQYCDVIVKRWEEFTGNKAVLNA